MEINVPEYDFPEAYDDNYITLLVRDPRCLFAFWELTSEQMSIVSAGLGCPWSEVTLVLRVYDLTDPGPGREKAAEYFDLQVHALANNYYIYNAQPNHTYFVDLGINAPNGRFITLVRSQVVHTPRDRVAELEADLFVQLTVDLPAGSAPEGSAGPGAERGFSSDGVYIAKGED